MKNFSITDFIAHARNDGMARQNRFWINLGVIPKMFGETGALLGKGGGKKELEKIHLFCKAINLAGVQIATSTVRLTGEPFEIPYGRNFSPSTFIFYVDRNLMVRQYFEDWVNSIVNPDTRELGYYADYCTTIEIFVLDKTETNSVYKITLNDAHPKSVGNLALDQENNQFMLLDVTIDYRNYRTELLDYVPTVGGTAEKQITGGISNLMNNFDSILQTFNNDFVSFQSTITNPFTNFAVNYNLLDTGQIIGNINDRLFGSVKARVLR